MPDEVEALSGREELQRDRHQLDDLVEGARSRRSQKGLQLRKREFDRIAVRTVGREKAHARADRFDRRLHFRLLVHREVVEHHDIATPERGDQYLLDVGEKRGIVDRAVEDRGRAHAVDTQRRHHRVRLPMAVGRVIPKAEAAGTAAVATEQIRRHARFIAGVAIGSASASSYPAPSPTVRRNGPRPHAAG